MLLNPFDLRPDLTVYLGGSQYFIGWVRYKIDKPLSSLFNPNIGMSTQKKFE